MRRDPAGGERSGDMKRLRHWLFNFAAAVSRTTIQLTLAPVLTIRK
jgi:hypothetical protein